MADILASPIGVIWPPRDGSATSIFERMLARGVVVRPWGPPYGTWLRISVGRGEDNAACLGALRAALDEGR